MKLPLIGSLIAVLALIGICVLGYTSAYSVGNRLEASIKATYEDNQNILSNYGKSIAEAAQIPAMQRDDQIAVIEAALNARYGEDGTQAMFQMISEQNPNLDSAVYTKIQQIIQAGRKDFEIGQRKIIDQKRTYETALGSLWTGFWLKIAGFPRIDLADYAIVTDARTDEAFRTKQEEAIQLR